MHIKKGDTVVLLSGDYKDKWDVKEDKDGSEKKRIRKTGKVIAVSPEENKVIVENINKATKHVKARRQGEQSAIVKVDAPMYACKVALYCPKCDKGVRTHIEVVDGKKIRVCSGKDKNGNPCGHKFD